jgi:pyrroline-5-carboxylate reductase
MEVVRSCDIVLIAVKPNHVAEVLREISSVVHANHLIISIAAGVRLSQLEKVLGFSGVF